MFLTFMLSKFLVRTLQSTEILILDLFCTWKYEKNTLKSKIFITQAKTVKIHVLKCGLRPTVYIKVGL